MHHPPLFYQKAVSIVHVSWETEVKAGHLPVEKVEGLCKRPAVELGFDSLRVRVRCQLLARVLCDQKQCIVLGVGDLELVSAEWADLLCGCVRVNDQSFGRAACAHLLQGYTEIVLQRDTKSGVLKCGSADTHQLEPRRQKNKKHTSLISISLMQLLNIPLEGAPYLKHKTDLDAHAKMLVGTADISYQWGLACSFPLLRFGCIWNWYDLDSLPGCSRRVQVRRDTWKSSTDGAERWAVRRQCHWCRVFLASELSTRAACSSWKFLIRAMAP